MPSPRSLSLGLTLVLCSFANIVQAVPPPSGVAPSPTQTYVSPPPSEATKTPETGSGQGQAVPLRKKNGVPLTNDDGTANLDSLHRQVGLVVAKYQNTIAAYLLNTGTAIGRIITPATDLNTTETTSMTSSRLKLKKKRSGGEDLTDYNNDLLWAGTVGIGTPQQQFTVLFDTGSADFWIPSSECQSQACTGDRFDASSSDTAVPKQGTFSIFYGDGSTTSGPVVADTVTVGKTTVNNMVFSPATSVSDSFVTDPEDGIMGMAYASISTLQVKTQNRFSGQAFGFRMAKTSVGTSELFIGGANPKHYSGAIEYHPVLKQAYFNISGQPFLNGVGVLGIRTTVIDTGTTVIIAPPQDAAAFWSLVPGASRLANSPGYFTYPCATPPRVSFGFGGKQWAISAADINLGRTSAGSTSCVGAITGVDVGLGSSTWILGCSFLKNVYSVFDTTKNVVGFATPM